MCLQGATDTFKTFSTYIYRSWEQHIKAETTVHPTVPQDPRNSLMASASLQSYGWLTFITLSTLPFPPTSTASASNTLRALVDTVFVVHPAGFHGHQYVAPSRRRRAVADEKSTEEEGDEPIEEDVPLEPAVIEQLHVDSNVSARFGVTEYNMVMLNNNEKDLEVTFEVSTLHNNEPEMLYFDEIRAIGDIGSCPFVYSKRFVTLVAFPIWVSHLTT